MSDIAINQNQNPLPFVTLEGLDGAGKTTVLQALIPWLKQNLKLPVVITREPGGDRIAEQIRRVLLNPKNDNLTPTSELLLYEAARAQLMQDVIIPALQHPKFVICDRFMDSTTAYQGTHHELSMSMIDQLNHFVVGHYQPTLTLYYQIPPKLGLQRIQAHRHGKIDRMDNQTDAYYQHVSRNYTRLIKQYPHRIQIIDGTQPLADRIAQSQALLQTTFQQYFKPKLTNPEATS